MIFLNQDQIFYGRWIIITIFIYIILINASTPNYNLDTFHRTAASLSSSWSSLSSSSSSLVILLVFDDDDKDDDDDDDDDNDDVDDNDDDDDDGDDVVVRWIARESPHIPR